MIQLIVFVQAMAEIEARRMSHMRHDDAASAEWQEAEGRWRQAAHDYEKKLEMNAADIQALELRIAEADQQCEQDKANTRDALRELEKARRFAADATKLADDTQRRYNRLGNEHVRNALVLIERTIDAVKKVLIFI